MCVMEPSVEVLRSRLNGVFRARNVLDQYVVGVLRHSPVQEEHKAVLEEVQLQCLVESGVLLQQIRAVTGREYEKGFFVAAEVVVGLLSSEYFFEVRPLLDQVVGVYERNLVPLVERFRISPLDLVRVYRMGFV